MNARLNRQPLAAALIVGAFAAAPCAAGTVDFETESTGSKPDGYVTDDSTVISFTDTLGADLDVFNYGNQGIGQSLAVNGDDASQLQMDFTSLVTGFTLFFGNDDPSFSSPGDVGALVGMLSGVQVAYVEVVINEDDIMNQSISLAGPIDQAFFYYGTPAAVGNATPIGLIEIVDDISFTVSAVPSPAAAGGGIAMLGLLGLSRRRA